MNQDPTNPQGESSVDKLSQKLNSRTRYQEPQDLRKEMKSEEVPDVRENWESPELKEILMAERRQEQPSSFMRKMFIFSLIFFVAAILIAGKIFLGGSNFVSSKNVDITVVGPTQVSAGEILDLGVTIHNRNNADLELVNFSVQYPQSARDPADTSQTLNYEKEPIGEIGAGDEVVRNVEAILFGATDEVMEFRFSVEYKVKGSKATFYKDKIYEVVIGDAPVTLDIESPGKVTSGEDFVTLITVKLNSTEPLRGVMVRGEYPYGYSVIDSTPKAVANKNIWSLGDIAPGDERVIELSGRLSGEDSSERTFRFYVGLADGPDAADFRTILTSAHNTLAISRPSVGVDIAFNGSRTTPYIAPVAGTVNVSLSYENNLPDKIVEPRLEVRLSGAALDKFSVIPANGGFYNSSSDTLVWNLTNSQGERGLNPGEGGRVSFRFNSLSELPAGTSGRQVNVSAIVTGKSVGSSKSISATDTGLVRFASEVNLSSEALYSRGPFSNTGPIPPKVDEETTYTITFSVGNTGSAVEDSKVVARLGQNVSWVKSYSLESEDISYDESANLVTWNIGTLSGGSGFTSDKREASFQVSLKPSISQIGATPTLVSGINFTGDEDGSMKNITNPNLTTRISSDPTFVQGDGIVAR